MTSSTGRGEVLALLADIKENPREDGLRLILADWLDDFGGPLDQARAELIRFQIDHERLPDDDPARSHAQREALALLHRHGKAWLGPLAEHVSGWQYNRGLLAVVARVASLRSRKWMALAGSEAWAWVEAVQLDDCDSADIRTLAHCPLLTEIVSLGFRPHQLGPAGAQAIGHLPWIRRIETLSLDHQPINDAGLAALLRSPHLYRLRHLSIAKCNLTAKAGRILADAGPGVEGLALWGNSLGTQGPAAVVEGSLPNLHRLDLRVCGIDDEGARRLAHGPGLRSLRELDLADNPIGPEGALALARSPYLESIQSLSLWGNPVEAAGARHLRERFGSRVHVSPTPG